MKGLYPVLLCLILFTGISCNKKETADVTFTYDQAILGKDYGLSGISKYYLINSDGVFRRTGYQNGVQQFESTSQPADKGALAKDLLNHLPAYLYRYPDTYFGCPNCTDQGRIYIEVQRNGTTTHWEMDTDITALPKEIRDFAEKASATVDQL